jgi:hypothetical protein
MEFGSSTALLPSKSSHGYHVGITDYMEKGDTRVSQNVLERGEGFSVTCT